MGVYIKDAYYGLANNKIPAKRVHHKIKPIRKGIQNDGFRLYPLEDDEDTVSLQTVTCMITLTEVGPGHGDICARSQSSVCTFVYSFDIGQPRSFHQRQTTVKKQKPKE